MGWRNTDTEWGTGAKVFHWVMAAVIIGSSIFVLHVNDSTYWFKSTPEIFIRNINTHKLLGLLALALVIGRLLWRRRGPVPVTSALTPFEERASKWTHRALYALMIIVPILGWLSSSSFGSPVKFFGLFNFPLIWPRDRVMIVYFYWSHFVLSWTLLALVGFHAAAALYHHFRKKDGVLRAMLPGRRKSTEPERSV